MSGQVQDASAPVRPPPAGGRRAAPVWRTSCAAAVVVAPPLGAMGLATALGQMSVTGFLLCALWLAFAATAMLRAHLNRLDRVAQALEDALGDSAPREVETDASDRKAADAPLTGRLWRAARRARAALAEAGRRAASHDRSSAVLLDGLPDPLVLVGEDRSVLRLNPAAREVFSAPLGADVTALTRAPSLLEALDRIVRGESERETVRLSLPTPVERAFDARLTKIEAADPDRPQAPTVSILLHDVTAIERSERMRADFIANASHELRTPLASLSGFIETLGGAAEDDPEARRRFLALMGEQTDRMARLVQDLMALSRIELVEHARPSGRVDLAALLQRLCETLETAADRKSMTIAMRCCDALAYAAPARAAGDRDQLFQLFENLIDNAIKYGREGSEIRVGISAYAKPGAANMQHVVAPGIYVGSASGTRRLAGAGLRVAVTDRGGGIPRAHLPRLTERFYRVDDARSRAVGGTGLGLAIVKHIAMRHRGVLEIESAPDKGSRFTVHLPAA